jgi:hypothetical protein
MVAGLHLIEILDGFVDLVGLGLPVIECQCDLAFFKVYFWPPPQSP